MTFRFLHLADLHLETRYGGREGTRDRLRRATLQAFERAVDLALDRELDAVLVAGDLFDESLLSLRAELELVRQVRRLTDRRVWFLYACGNHDPGRDGGRAARLGLENEERVRVFRTDEPRTETITDAAGRPIARVTGVGHPRDAYGENLAARFPDPRSLGRDLPNVALLHTQVESARAAEQHDRYAPSTPEDFERLRYDYWALGHVHLRQQAVDGLPVWYPGNLVGRNARETGPKGGLVVELSARGAAEPEFVSLAPVRWERRRLDDLAELDTAEALAHRLADAMAEACRGGGEVAMVLELAGASPLAPRLFDGAQRDALEEELAARGGLLELQLRPDGLHVPFDADELRSEPTVLAKALELLERAGSEDALLDLLAPGELAGLPGASEDDLERRRAYLRELLGGLDGELIARLRVREEA